MSSATITTHDDLYRQKRGAPTLVDVPPARFLMIDGRGSPDGEAFQEAVAALYATAYTAKFALKKADGPDVKVPPLEGLFERFPDPEQAFDPAVRARFRWTLMLRVPEPIDNQLVERARAEAMRKKNAPAIQSVRVEEFDEGTCAQVPTSGPTRKSSPPSGRCASSFAGMAVARGRHHEIYFSVPGRTKPERMKTILRQPVS